MTKERTKTRRIVVISLALLSALMLAGALYLFLVPVDLSGYHSRIESIIESRTGHKITVERIVLKALPSPDISLKGIKVFSGTEEVLDAGSLRLRMALLPVFVKSLVIEHLDIERAGIVLRRDEKGNLNVAEFFRPEEKKKGGFKVSVRSLNLKDSRIRITDEALPERPSYDIRNINAYLYESPRGFTYKVEGRLMPDTRLSVSGTGDQKGGISGAGALKDLELIYLNPYVKKESPGSSVKGRVNVDFSFKYAGKSFFKGTVTYRGIEAAYPAALGKPVTSASGSAVFNLLSDEKGTEVNIDDIRLSLDDFNLNGSFKLEGPPLKRAFALRISTTPIPLQTFKDLLPLKALPETPARKISNVIPAGGSMTIESLSASGPVEDIKSGEIFKKPGALSIGVVLSNLQFRYRGMKEAFSEITGGVLLKQNVLTFKDIRGRYGKEEIESLKGRLWDLTGNINYDLSVKGLFDAEETLGLARDFAKENEAALADKLEKIDASGDVGLDLSLRGAVEGRTPLRYSGTSDLKGVRLSYKGFPLSLESVDGALRFDNKRISFEDLRASDAHSSLSLKGHVDDYTEDVPSFDLGAEGSLSGATLSLFNLRGLQVNGSIPFSASLSGSRNSFDAGVILDATPAGVSYRRYLRKEPDYPLSLETSVRLEGKELVIKTADLKFSDSSASLSGNVSIGRPVYRLSLNSKQIRIADLINISPYLSKEYESDGLVSFKLNATRESAGSEPSYDGKVRVEDAHFKTPLIAKPIERVNAIARFNGNRASIVIDRLSAGQTEISGKVDILDISGRVVKFDIYSPQLYTEDLVPKKEIKAPERKEEEKKAKPPVTGKGIINIRGGSIWGHRFNDFHADADLDKDVITLKPFSLYMDKGHVLGNFTYYRNPAEPRLFEGDFEIKNIHLESFISAFGAKKKVLSGDLQGKGSIYERRDATPFSSGLNGEVSLYSEKGKLWKGPILTSIFAIVNIISIDELFKEGLPYKNISGDFFINDGIIFSDNLLFDSDSMRMSAHGKVDIPGASIDSILAIHPFVTIDKIISKIPLAGWILAGKEKSTISMYFDVTGPLKDPSVAPKPIMALQKGILGIFERLLEAPGEILKQEPEKKR